MVSMEAFVARQPIFDRYQNVYAYELLYRNGTSNFANITDADHATAEVITNTLLLIGIDSLTGGKKAFINFTGNLLGEDFVTLFPKELVVIEILEDVEPDEKVITSCRNLKELGYTLVLDDFVYDTKYEPLIEIADIIKVDFINNSVQERRNIVKRLKKNKIKFLAEKVETLEEFHQAVEMGYDYFQGYFFSKPVIFSGQDMPAYKAAYFQLIKEIGQQEPDFNKIEDIIRKDVSLAYKLLKYINSPVYGFKTKISSIKHALVLLGVTEVKKWITILALREISSDKPDEIMRSCIVRARVGELLSSKLGLEYLKSDFFLTGLFSMIDALTNKPLDKVLSDLPLPLDVKDAILGKKGKHRDVLDITLSYEHGDWAGFRDLAMKMNLDVMFIPEIFVEALNWTDELFAC